MKSLVLKLIRKAANYAGGAATGMAMAAAVTPAGAAGLTGLLGIIALCLLTETAIEEHEPDTKLQSLELWLEELVRRHGKLETAVAAIAEGREVNGLVSQQAASTLRIILSMPDDGLTALPNQDARVSQLISIVSTRFSRLDERTRAIWEREATLLSEIRENTSNANQGMRELMQMVAILPHQFEGIARQMRGPSDDAIARSAIDESDNCRLRHEKLKDLLDCMEFETAEEFADRCFNWLQQSSGQIFPYERARLLEQLIDEAIVRLRTSSERDRAIKQNRLRFLGQRALSLLDSLDEADRLRLSSHVAYVESKLDGVEVGMSRLEGRHDPYAVRRKLGMLFDERRFHDAAELVRGSAPLAEWIDKAIQVFARSGDWNEAERILEWSLVNATPLRQTICRLLFVDTALASLPGGIAESVTPLPADNPPHLQRCATLLRPLVDNVLSHVEPRHELDCCVLRLSLTLANRLGKVDEVQQIAAVLARRRPLELLLGELAVDGPIEAGLDWPQRLRSEGPSSFERRLVAAALEGKHADKRHIAFQAALRLKEDAFTAPQRAQLHNLLQFLAQQLGESEQRQVEELAPSLVGSDDRQLRMWTAIRMLNAGPSEGLEELIEELRDPSDPLWLQLRGQRFLQNGEPEKGVDSLTEAACILNKPKILTEVAGLAIGHKRWQAAVSLLDRLCVFKPNDRQIRSHLAMSLYHLERFERAASILASLAGEFRDDPTYGVNASVCLRMLGRSDEAMNILRAVCDHPEPPREAVVGLAQVLVERDLPKQACAVLNKHKSRFWDDYRFVGAYWSIAYAAEDEGAGDDAFVQMQLLQASGIAPNDMVVSKSLADLVEMSKEHQERERRIANAILEGKLPWLMAAEWRREPAFQAWAERTKPRSWVLEHPSAEANAAIYCTNWFTVATVEAGRELIPIEASRRGQPFVVDLSALLTLQNLGLLESAAAYCGRLHVPSSYLFKMFSDSEDLRPHQPSRRTVLGVLRAALATQRIRVEHADGRTVYRRVDEYYPPEQSRSDVYHLADLHAALKRGGAATDAQLKRLKGVSHRPVATPANLAALQKGESLSIGLSTLSTLHGCGLLDTLLEHYHVHLTSDDYKIVQGESQWFDKQEHLRRAHQQLWEFLRDDARVERHVGTDVHAEDSDGDDANPREHELALEAMSLANRLTLPLLVDDRSIQATSLNATPRLPSCAFSTVHLLAAMADTGHIPLEIYAAATVSLMKLRYRFIVPEPRLLHHWALESMSAMPGPTLQIVARYLRSSMRDHGLFSGIEPTQPPTTIAKAFHTAVESAVGEFLGSVWTDESVTEDDARSLTRWSVIHLLPAPSRGLEGTLRIEDGLGVPVVWSSFLVQLATHATPSALGRTRNGVAALAESLGMSHRDSAHIVTETINALGRHHRRA